MMRHAEGVVFEGVSKRYGDVTAVDDVSFTVASGELVTLLGPSGCGKTTTLRMVAGLEAVSGGRVSIGGRDVTLLAANERDVSMVFQSYALFPHMNVLENVCYGPISMRVDKAKARELARAKLAMLGLSGFEKRLPERPRGYYREYTVPTPGSRDRGARRIVAGGGRTGDVAASGEYYYTQDHYRNFRRIQE